MPPSSGQRYELLIAPGAARAIRDRLPEAVAAAGVEFITGPLLDNPHRVGKPLQRQLPGLWSARRGLYRVLYEIDDRSRIVRVVDASHRGDAYRPREGRVPMPASMRFGSGQLAR